MVARVRFAFAIGVLGSLVSSASAQAPAPEGGVGAPAVAEPAPVLVQQAWQARSAGKLVEVNGPADLSSCRDLGDEAAASTLAGLRGRARMRIDLKNAAKARGASHVQYLSYVDGVEQTERARLFDCALGADPGPQALGTVGAAGTASTDTALSLSARAVSGRAPRGLVSAVVELIPAGSLDVEVGSASGSVDTATTVGFSGSVDYLASPAFAVGASPRLVFNVKAEDAMASATQFDLRVRLRAGRLAGPGLLAYGFAAPGVSWIRAAGDTSFGPTLDLGAGVAHAINANVFVTVEVGYQLGWQEVSAAGIDAKLASNLVHLGLGIGTFL